MAKRPQRYDLRLYPILIHVEGENRASSGRFSLARDSSTVVPGSSITLEWGQGSASWGDLQKEVIVTIQMFKPDDPNEVCYEVVETGTFTYIPPAAGDECLVDELNQDEVLDDLRKFGRYFADHVDYVQLYNEAFRGQEVYLFDSDACSPPYTGPISLTPCECLSETCELFFDWVDECRQAVLEGSARAGRPLRFISPAVTGEFATAADGGDPDSPCDSNQDRNALIMRDLIAFANNNGMLFDSHYHYANVTEVSTQLAVLFDAAQAWPLPDEPTCQERGPKPSGSWWATNEAIVEDYYCPPPGLPTQSWNSFLIDTLKDPPPFSGSWGMTTALTDLSTRGFYHACYGPTKQRGVVDCATGVANGLDLFVVAALRADKVDPFWLPLPGFSDLCTDFQTAAQPYSDANPNMLPHSTPLADRCPTCP